MPATVQVVQSAAAAAVLFKPERLRLLQILAEPDSAAGVAKHLELPRQTVNYHLHELEREGFVEFVEHRQKGNCLERVFRATARSYVISPLALGALGSAPGELRDRFSASCLIAAAARLIRDLSQLRRHADRAGKKLATISLETEIRFASAKARQEFTEEALQTFAALAARYHDQRAPSGRAFRFLFAGLPAITTDEPPDQAPVRME